MDMDVDSFETTIKVIAVGNGRVGKTSMTTQYCKGVFTADYKKTIGVDFMEKTIDMPDGITTVRMMVWDTAGQEEFDALTSRYYKGAGAALLVFSCTDRDSFDALPMWKKKVEAEAGGIAMAMVQNKMDLHHEALMTDTEVEEMATRLGLRLYRTCVKQNSNVNEAFEYVAGQYILRGGSGAVEDAVAHITDFAPEEKTATAGAGAGTTGGGGGAGGGVGATASNTATRGGEKVQLKVGGGGGGGQSLVGRAGASENIKLGGGGGAGGATGGTDSDAPSKRRTGGKKSLCIIL